MSASDYLCPFHSGQMEARNDRNNPEPVSKLTRRSCDLHAFTGNRVFSLTLYRDGTSDKTAPARRAFNGLPGAPRRQGHVQQ